MKLNTGLKWVSHVLDYHVHSARCIITACLTKVVPFTRTNFVENLALKKMSLDLKIFLLP